jgi:hypothetical protein
MEQSPIYGAFQIALDITLNLTPMTAQPTSEVSLTLTADETLVLFEFLQRFSNTDALAIEDQSEQRALWNLCCVLEKNLHQAFDVDYKTAIENARNRLRDEQ